MYGPVGLILFKKNEYIQTDLYEGNNNNLSHQQTNALLKDLLQVPYTFTK